MLAAQPEPLLAGMEPLERSFTVRRWTADDGLPGNSVQDLGYGPDGLLWGASGDELWRFDGVRFAVATGSLADAPTQGERIKSFACSLDHGLYVQTVSGWNHLAHGRWRRISMEPGIGSITTFSTSGSGWNLALNGLMRSEGGEGRFYPMPGPGEVGHWLTWAAPDACGSNIWVSAIQGLFRFSGERYHREPIDDTGGGTNLEHVYVGDSGQVWVYGHPDRFYLLREGRWHLLPKPVGEWPERMGVEAMVERNGSELWVGTAHGLFRWDGRAWSRLEPTGLTPSGVIALLVGRGGEVWAGLEGGGLLCLRERRISMVRAPDGPSIQPFAAVYEGEDGTLYAGIANAGLWGGSLERLERMEIPRLYRKSTVLAIARDAQGRLLLGQAGGGLLRYANDSAEMLYPGATVPWMDFGVRAVMPEPAGRVWVGTQRGLMFATDDSDKLFWVAQGQHAIKAMAQADDGRIWVARDHLGVMPLRMDDGEVFDPTEQPALPFPDVRALRVDSRGRLWAGGASGLAYRDDEGQWRHVDAPGVGTVVQILEDASGKVWIGTLQGIACLVSEGEPSKLVWYGRGDGLDNEVCSGGFGNAGCRLADGRLLFPTQDGLAVVDPQRLSVPTGAASPLVDEVLADGQVVWRYDLFGIPDGRTPPAMAPGTRAVTLRYLTANVQEGEGALFRYRMGNHSSAWSPWSRARAAVFENLPPGRHMFRLQAATRNGQEVEMVAMEIRLLPFWWQRRSVQAATAAALLLGLGLGGWRMGRWRLHRRLEQLQREQTVDAERSRISRELHDDVGASLTQIAMMSQGLAQDTAAADAAAMLPEKIFHKARAVIRSLDEIVWSLSPRHDRLENMLVYFASYAREYLAVAHIRCRIHLPDADLDHTVPSAIRHHLYLAFKESLHNIVKHAQAQEVWIRINLRGSRLLLEISDDGKGLPAGGAAAIDADGIVNLDWRMRQVGGECRHGRSVAGGLETILSVPLHG
jgi:signal transduction histidine kinase/ligand-binding sensor domain-containing protein